MVRWSPRLAIQIMNDELTTESMLLDFDGWLKSQTPEVRAGIEPHLKAAGVNAGREKKRLASMFAISQETGIDLDTIEERWHDVRGGYAEQMAETTYGRIGDESGGEWMAVKNDDDAFGDKMKEMFTKRRDFRVQEDSFQQAGAAAAIKLEPTDSMADLAKIKETAGTIETFTPEEADKFTTSYRVARAQTEAVAGPLRPVAREIYTGLSKGRTERFGGESQAAIESAIDKLTELPEAERGLVVAMLKSETGSDQTGGTADKTASSAIRGLTGQLRGFASNTERGWLASGIRELSATNTIDASLDTPEKIVQRIATGGLLKSELEGDISGNIAKPSREVTPEEKAKAQQMLKAKLKRNEVAAQAIGILEGTIDPIKTSGLFQKIAVNVGSSLGAMAPIVIPYAGLVIAQGGYADQEYQRQRSMGTDPVTAHEAAQITGIMQAGIERLSYLFAFSPNSAIGKLSPKFTSPGLVTNFAAQTGAKLATIQGAEYSEEIAQAAAPILTAALGESLGWTLPEQARYAQEITQFDKDGGFWRPEVYLTVSALTIFGGGYQGIRNTAQARATLAGQLADPTAMVALGIQPDTAATIAALPEAERLNAYRAAYSSRNVTTPEAIAAQQTITAQVDAALDQGRQEVTTMQAEGITIQRTNEGWNVVDDTDGTAIPHATAEDAMSTARSVLTARGIQREDTFLNALDEFTGMMAPGRTIQLSEKSGNLLKELEDASTAGRENTVQAIWDRADEYRASKGQAALERDKDNPDSRDALEGLIVLGRSSTEAQGNAARSISLIMREGRTLDLVEEQAENDLREAVIAGRTTMATMKDIIDRIQTATGDTYRFKDGDVGTTEAWSRLVRLYTTGTRKGNKITSGARAEMASEFRAERQRLRKAEAQGIAPAAFAKMREYLEHLKSIMGQVSRLMKARDAGHVDDLEAMIRESVGLKEQDAHEAAVVEAVPKEYPEAAPPDPMTGLGAHGYSITDRARDADYMAAVQSGDVAKQQSMVDDAAKAAGYDVGRIMYHGGTADTVISPRDFYTHDRPVSFLSSSPDHAAVFAGENGKVHRVYYNPGNQVETNEFNSDYEALNGTPYDSVISKGIRDAGHTIDEVVITRPNQVKSADPITRDDNGNVIPLSERFNPASDSTSYSLKTALVPANVLADRGGVPRTLDDFYAGKSFIPIEADKTGAGGWFGEVAKIPAQGGPAFPLMPDYLSKKVAWASSNTGYWKGKLSAARDGGLIYTKDGREKFLVAPYAMKDDSHTSNASIIAVKFSELERYVAEGRLDDKQEAAIAEMLNQAATKQKETAAGKMAGQVAILKKFGAEDLIKSLKISTSDEVDADAEADAEADADADADADAPTTAKGKKEKGDNADAISEALKTYKKQATVVAQMDGILKFPKTFTAAQLQKFREDLSFPQRKWIADKLSSAKAESLGVPPMDQIRRTTLDPSTPGVSEMSIFSLLEIDVPRLEEGLENGTLKGSDFGVPAHGSYDVFAPGSPVVHFRTPVPYVLAMPDMKEALDDQGRTNHAYYLKGRMPGGTPKAQPITAEMIKRWNETQIDAMPNQAKAIVAALNDQWIEINKPRQAGVADFIRAIRNNDAAVTLSQYTDAQVSEMLKAKALRIFRLPIRKVKKVRTVNGEKENYEVGEGEIWFALKRPVKEDGDGGNPETDWTIVSVMNNEGGANGIMPLLLYKAVQSGGTYLDCFAVKSAKFPEGLLPTLYSRAGFTSYKSEPFDESYYTKPGQMGELTKVWESQGWAGQERPGMVWMKHEPAAAKSDTVATESLAASADGSGMATGAGAKAGTAADSTAAPVGGSGQGQARGGLSDGASPGRDAGNDGGTLPGGSGSSSGSQVSRFIAKLRVANDSQLVALGLSRSEAVSAIEQYDKASAQGTSFAITSADRLAKQQKSLEMKMTRAELLKAIDNSSDWKDFYTTYQYLLDEYFGDDATAFQSILSITSQATSVKANVGIALRMYGYWKRGEEFDGKLRGEAESGALAGVLRNLERWRDDVALSGRKISNYDAANKGAEEKVVVDRHVAGMLFGTKTPSAAQFTLAEKILTDIAHEIGWQPRQVQAALWAASIRKSGLEPASYDAYLKTLRERGTIYDRTGATPGGGGIFAESVERPIREPSARRGSKANQGGTGFSITTADRLTRVADTLASKARDPEVKFKMFDRAQSQLRSISRDIGFRDDVATAAGESASADTEARHANAMAQTVDRFSAATQAREAAHAEATAALAAAHEEALHNLSVQSDIEAGGAQADGWTADQKDALKVRQKLALTTLQAKQKAEVTALETKQRRENDAAGVKERQAIKDLKEDQAAVVRDRATYTAEGAQRRDMLRWLSALDTILMPFPAEVRGKVGGFVKLAGLRTNASMETYLKDRVDKLDKVLEEYLRTEYLEAINKTLEKARPDREAGKKSKGKLGADVHRFFDEVERVKELTPAQVTAERVALAEAYLGQESEDGGAMILPTEEQMADLWEKEQILDTFGALGRFDAHDAAHMARALDVLNKVYTEGRNRWRILEEARLAEVKMLADSVISTLGGAGYAGGQKNKARSATLLGKLASLPLDMKSFPEIMVSLLGEGSPLAKRWSRAAREAFAQKNDNIRALRQRWTAALETATGKKGVKARRALWDMGDPRQQKITVNTAGPGTASTEQIPIALIEEWSAGTADPAATGVSTAEAQDLMEARLALDPDSAKIYLPLTREKRGPFESVPMTEAEGVFLTMLANQEQYAKALDRAGWDADAVAQVEEQISPAAKSLRSFLSKEYQEGYAPLAKVFERMFGVGLPQIKNYAPAAFYSMGTEQVMDPTGSGTVEGGFRAGFLKNRKNHSAAPKLENAFATFFGHANQTAHWKGMAEVVRELSGVFGKPEVKRAIEAQHGKEMLGAVNQWIKALEGNGLQVQSGFLDQSVRWLTTQQTYIALAWKLGTLMKQSSAVLGAAYRMPTKAYLKGFVKLLTGQLDGKAMFASPVIQRRLETGFAPEVRAAMNDIWSAPPTLRSEFLVRGMELIGLTDAIFTTGSAAIAYDYHYAEALKAGMGEAEAKTAAMQEVDDIVGATAQPADAVDRSLFELRQGAFGKLVFLFASEARQKSSLWLGAWQNVAKGKATPADVRTLMILHLIVGPAMHAITAGFRDARDDDDDELFDPQNWDPLDFLKAIVAGPLAGLPLIGSAVSGFTDSGVLGRFQMAGSSVMDVFEGAPKTEDETAEWYFKRISKVMQGLDAFTGVVGSIAGQTFGMLDNAWDTPEEEQAQKKRRVAKEKADAKKAAAD